MNQTSGHTIRLILLFVLAGFSPQMASSQNAILRGFVSSGRTGEPLQGVNIALFRAATLVTGGVTDSDGFFALSRLDKGFYKIRISSIGFSSILDSLSLGADEIRLYNAVLEEEEAALDEVVVETGKTTGVARAIAGQTTITPAQIDRIPSPDVSGDLINYLSNVPGIVSTGDRGGQLFVRGGEPWQNLILLDGMWIYQPFHILGFFSSFPSEIVNRVDLYAGGYGSEFGGILSSVIDVRSRNGNKNHVAASASIAPFVAGGHVEGPLMNGKVSYLVSVRQSVIEQGASRLVRDPLPFSFGDQFAKIHSEFSSNSQFSATLLRTNDRGVIFEGNPNQPREEIQWKNRALGIRYIVLPRAFPVFVEFLISGSRLTTSQGPVGNPIRTSRLASLNTTVNVSHFYGDVQVNWGLFARTQQLESDLNGLFQNFSAREEFVTEVGLFVEPKIRVNERFNVTGGIRIQSFPSKSVSFIEPRLKAIYDLGRTQLSLAAGVYHQEVIGVSDRRDAASVFTAWTSTPGGKVPEATHLIAGLKHAPTTWLQLGAEGYYKTLDDLLIPEWTAFPRLTTRLQQAEGRVWGADLKMEVKKGAFDAFITYGISNVQYTAKQASLQLWFGSSRLNFRPAHDRRHQVNAVVSVDVKKFKLDLRWQFGSGLPFNQAVGFDGFLLLNGAVDVFNQPGGRRVIYEKPFNGELPTYHRFDMSLSRRFEFPDVALTGQIGVINAYDRQNLFYLDVFTLRRVDQLPVIPTFGLKLDIK
jgi:CarboxypepD_reg-like domain/TonB-dependent Receptor Plug Domain/TonB dependent receptor-like, beta-barrel